MDANELREHFKNAPDWAFVGLVDRISKLEAKVDQLMAKKKRTTKKVRNGTK